MKKNEFRSMVKEIIKEVINEMDVNENTPGEDDADKPVDMSDLPSLSDPKKSFKTQARGFRRLDKIKQEPGFQDKLKAVQQKRGDAPLPHKTSTNRGDSKY